MLPEAGKMNSAGRDASSFWLWLSVFGIFPGSAGFCQPPPASGAFELGPAIPAVVQLMAIGPGESGKNRECSATGFLINEEGYILTNAHVIEQAQHCLAATVRAKIVAKFATPQSEIATAVSCDIVGLDGLHDLAVMKTERALQTDLAGSRIALVALDSAEVAVGTPVFVTGHPAFAWHALTQSGKIICRRSLRLLENSAEPTEVIVLNIPLRVGNSGSPVYLEAGGGVIGVVERQDPGHPSYSVAVPIRYAIALLNRHGVRWHPSRR